MQGSATSKVVANDDGATRRAAFLLFRTLILLTQIFPLVKFGAYLLVLESAFMALCVGILALAPPPIVGAMSSVPSWSKDLVAAVAFVTAAWQIIGLASVITDQKSLYRLYIRVNFLATVVILAITIAFTVTAAARHDEAVDACYREFEGSLAQDGLGVQSVEESITSGRHKVCNILAWVDVGLMGGLIVLLGVMQLFMCYMQRMYGQRQRNAIVGTKEPFGPEGIPMGNRSHLGWDPRPRKQYAPLNTPAAYRPTNVGPTGETFYETYNR
ncbi:hypothetical protein CBS9595_001642 [Malassezia furfur]|nr:hypothetical protein CBS9595_001642 [Malassezia furfur]